MADTPKRWVPNSLGGMDCWPTGGWVEYKDYAALEAERDALRKAVDGYAYIGRDGKVTLAKALEDERDQLRNTLKQISSLPVPGKFGVSGEKWIGWTDEQYEYYCRAWSDFRRKVAERLPEVNQKHTAHNAGLDAAINCINEFLSSERIGSHEYVKGQTECMLHLRDKISAMKSEGSK